MPQCGWLDPREEGVSTLLDSLYAQYICTHVLDPFSLHFSGAAVLPSIGSFTLMKMIRKAQFSKAMRLAVFIDTLQSLQKNQQWSGRTIRLVRLEFICMYP